MNQKFEYAVVTKAARDLAWNIFSNCRRWHTFSNIYGQLRWKQGEPWSVGSRLEIEILQPVRAIIDHVITFCEPGEKVGWIDHGLSVTIEQWVQFEPRLSGGTRIQTWGECVGSVEEIEGLAVNKLIFDFNRTWYDNFRAVCDQLTTVPAAVT